MLGNTMVSYTYRMGSSMWCSNIVLLAGEGCAAGKAEQRKYFSLVCQTAGKGIYCSSALRQNRAAGSRGNRGSSREKEASIHTSDDEVQSAIKQFTK